MQAELTPSILEFIQRHPIMIMAWLAIFAFTINSFFQDFTRKFKFIENTEAVTLMNDKEAIVVDIRSMTAFEKGHIVTSVNVLPVDIKSNNIAQLEKHKDKPIIVVDQMASGVGEKSAQGLTTLGFEQVYLLKDGITGWLSASLPLVNKHHKSNS